MDTSLEYSLGNIVWNIVGCHTMNYKELILQETVNHLVSKLTMNIISSVQRSEVLSVSFFFFPPFGSPGLFLSVIGHRGVLELISPLFAFE